MKKILSISCLLIIILVTNTNFVYAKFSSSTGEDETGSDQMYAEQLETKSNGNYSDKVIQSPRILEGDDDDFVIKNGVKGEKYWIHCYYELSGMDLDDVCVAAEVKSGKMMYSWQSMWQKENRGVTKDDDGDNSIEFMLWVQPMQTGYNRLRLYIIDDGEDKEFDFDVILDNVQKSAEEKLAEKIDAAWKDSSLLNTSGKNANQIAEDFGMYIGSDCKNNAGRNTVMTWSKSQITDKINRLKAGPADNYENQVIISSLEKIVEAVNAGKSGTALNGVRGNAVTTIAAAIVARIEALMSKFSNDGTDRGNVIFIDVLSNTVDYTPGDSDDGADELSKKASVILTIITNIGMVIAVLMCAIIGIKYMLGSVEEKAEYKNDMIPYLIGAGLLFGICTIAKILQEFGQNINGI